MRQRCVHTEYWIPAGAEKQTRKETTALHAARFVAAAVISPPKRNKEAVGREVTVSAEDPPGALPEIGDHHNVCLVITGAGFDPCLPLAHIVGGAQIAVAVGASNFQTTELVNQEEVD